jgi:hypothetical protein
MESNMRHKYGKFVLIGSVIFMWLAVIGLFKTHGYKETWRLWGVPAQDPYFLDFRLIPGSAESFRMGFEPTVDNPSDPVRRIFNYPAFWRLFFYTDITQNDTAWIVPVTILLFFAGVILFPQEINILDALLILLILFSPASMLLYERGNVDLIMFTICVLIVLSTGYSASWTVGLLVLGTVMKMFPFFGIPVLLRESKRKFIQYSVLCLLLVVAYIGGTFESQRTAWMHTARGYEVSYGAFVIITRLHEEFQNSFPNLFSFGQWKALFEIIALALILFTGIVSVRQPGSLTASYERNLAAFRMGASIYVGTFLLGNNWDYRLAFLILTIPQLSQWVFVKNKKYRIVSTGVVAAIVLSCWHLLLKFDLQIIPLKGFAGRSFIIDEFINWLLLPGFTYLLVASFPEWLRFDLQKMFGCGRIDSAKAQEA